MQTVSVTTPITVKIGDITDATTYNVHSSYSSTEFPVTIEGDWRTNQNAFTEDRKDGIFPPIILNGGYKGKGLRIYAVDNADFSQIQVNECSGCALEIKAMRQCSFQSVRLHRNNSPDCIFRITQDANRYSTNMVNFGQVICMANDAPTTIEMLSLAGSKNRLRIITFGMLVCHPTWQTLKNQFPGVTYPSARANRKHLHMDADDITIVSFNFRLEPLDAITSRAVVLEPGSVRVVMLNGQILRRRKDTEDFVDGDITTLVPTFAQPTPLASQGYKTFKAESASSINGPIVLNPFWPGQ